MSSRLEGLWQDLRWALRGLRKQPSFALAVLLCLALGTGAVNTIFGVVNAVLLEPLPYREPDRLMVLSLYFRDIEKSPVSLREFLDLREETGVFSGVGAMALQPVSLTQNGEAQPVVAARASSSLFQLLGSAMAVGRTVSVEEEKGEAAVVVLSHALWRDQFGADRSLVGRTILLNGKPTEVIGVLGEDFQFGASSPDLWLHLKMSGVTVPPRHIRTLKVVARLKPGVSPAQAQAELDLVAQRFQGDHPESYPGSPANAGGWGFRLQPMLEELVEGVRSTLWLLLGAVVLVLLVACVNVANLLLVRATVRRREVAIRTSLGAERGRLAQQFLAESLLVSGLGTALGLALAWGAGRLLVAFNPGNLPRIAEVGFDLRVLLVALGMALGVGVALGLFTSRQVSRQNLGAFLREGGRGATSSGNRLRRTLVVLQLGFAVVLLIGAGLVFRSLRALLAVDPGFRSDHRLVLELNLGPSNFPGDARALEVQQQLLDGIRRLPGVLASGAVSQLPLGGIDVSGNIEVEGRPASSDQPDPSTGWRIASPDLLRALGIPLLQGRSFNARDDERAEKVVLVDANLAQRLWPGESPLGRRIRLKDQTPELSAWRTVVGVVDNVRYRDLSDAEVDQLYLPLRQHPRRFIALVLHTAGDPLRLAREVRQTVQSVSRDLPIFSLGSLEERLRNSLVRPRFNALLFAAFAATALLLTVIGVYGVISYSVVQRQRDFGLRSALGAQRRDLTLGVVKEGLVLAALGIALGLGVAVAATRLLGKLLYGISPTDGVTYLAVAGGLGALVLLASYLPARRAARVDPLVALRAD